MALQLIPYGWDIHEGPQAGRVLREDLYKGLVMGVKATYFAWINSNANDSYFRRSTLRQCY